MRPLRAVWLLVGLCLAALPALAQNFGDVVITEVLYDDTSTAEFEWVEIHNTTASAIDIGDWVLLDDSAYPADGGEGAIRVPVGTTINPGQYLVLTKEAATGIAGAIVCMQYRGSFALGNSSSGDNLAMYTDSVGGTLIDGSLTVAYPDLTLNQGSSIEKCDPNATWTNDPAAWIESTTFYAATGRYRFCTPGAANTPCGGDTDPPGLTSITVISNTQIDVLFDEDVDQTIAETEANYTVNNGVGGPSLATRDGGNAALVHLTFGVMAPNTYQLTVLTIEDLAGNAASNLTGNFTIVGTATNSVVITEIMYDDVNSGANPDVEWVELHNTTASQINLGGWVLIDGPSYPVAAEGAWYIPAGTLINAGQYLVISGVEVPEITGEVICPDSGAGFGLNNGGDNLALFNALTGGTLIHGSLTTVYPDIAGTNLGNSIEVCLGDVGLAWDDVNWYESAAAFNAGPYVNCTPGAAPSACIPDVTSPVLLSATLFSPNQVDALFDEALDPVTANTATNYTVDNGVGNPTTAALQGDNRTVRLTFAASFTPNTYTLSVSNVTDVAGNAVAPNSAAQFIVQGSAYDVVFTEVMPNPTFSGTDDQFGEWFEVYNRGASAVNMSGWIISDNNGSDTLEGAPTIAAGAYFVFCSNGDSATNGGVPEDYAYHYGTSGWGLGLNNTGETLSLRDATNATVASVSYAGFPFASGVSAQLSDVNLDPSNPVNWCAAYSGWVGANNGDFGTPGAAALCSAPAIPDTVTICQIRQQTTCGVSLWDDSLLVTYGVVTHADSCRANLYVESNGCAVLVFGSAAQSNMIGATRRALPGDSVCIRGTLDRFAGLTEFTQSALEAAEVTFISQGNAVPGALTISALSISQNGDSCAPEANESRLVKVLNLTFVEVGTFAAGTNYHLASGNDTIQFRVNACDTLVGQAIPTTPINLTGMLAQYDTVTCYCQGYQILTGNAAPFEDAECGIPVQLTAIRLATLDEVELRWLAPSANSCGCYYVWYATTSEPVFPADYTLLTPTPISATQFTDITIGASARRIYVVTGTTCP